MNKQIRIRIINKTREYCILDMKELGLYKVSWEEYNKYYLTVDKIWAIPNEEMEKAQKEIDDIMGQASIYWLLSNSTDPVKKLSGYSGLATCQKELEEKYNIDLSGFKKLLDTRVNALNKFVTSHDCKNRQSKKEEVKGATNKLGDLCPGLENLIGKK